MDTGGKEKVWIKKGFSLLEINRPAEALECFTRALSIDPNNDIAMMGKNTCLRKLKELEKKKRLYKRL